MKLRPLLMAFLMAVCVSGSALADNAVPRPRLSVPLTRLTPKLTADPSDPAWGQAVIVPAMTVSIGEGGKGFLPLPTQVKLLWDQNNLYLRFVCTASEIYAPAKVHDADLYHGDVVEVFLDVQGDSRQWIELEVSPDNVTFDQLATLTAEPASNGDLVLRSDVLDRNWWTDLSWSLEGWQTAASIQKTQGQVTGWIVDMALPAKAVLHRLGRDKYQPMTLRANFLRYEELPGADPSAPRRFLAMNWAPVIYGCPHISPLAMGYISLTAP